MTDITELAQREKFEAWFKSSFHPDKTGPYIKDQLYFAWKAAGAELVEALEKEQRYTEELREWNAGLAQESCERHQLISELVPIRAAAEKLVRCKGRYHSEQNYRALAALFGVTTPDLPPLEHENVHYADAAEMEIAALRQRIAELEPFHTAYIEWSDKTAWVQTDKRFDFLKPWGKHRADVLKEYIQHLKSRTVTATATAAAADVLDERKRQVSAEGWTPGHDDEYEHGELADAAGCYALSSELFDCAGEPPRPWPWPDEWWKPTNRRRDLVKAGALILAEIERLDRAAGIKVEAE